MALRHGLYDFVVTHVHVAWRYTEVIIIGGEACDARHQHHQWWQRRARRATDRASVQFGHKRASTKEAESKKWGYARNRGWKGGGGVI